MAQQAASPKEGFVPHALPPLPYALDALEPYIDAKTMEIHHDKHHGAYVNNLNKALEGHAGLQTKSLEDLLRNLDAVPDAIRTTVRNNGGGHWNHSMFWQIMKKGGGGEPKGDLAGAIRPLSALSPTSNPSSLPRLRAALAPVGPGFSSAMASSSSIPRRTRTTPSWPEASPSWGWTSGSTPII